MQKKIEKEILKHFEFLGLKAKDKISGYEGVISSINFDLYGCIQVVISPSKKDDGTLPNGHYFDISRVEILDETPVMVAPFLVEAAEAPEVEVAKGKKGSAEKPPPR